MWVGGFCGGGARGGRLAVAAYPTAVGPAQSACYNKSCLRSHIATESINKNFNGQGQGEISKKTRT